MADSPTLSPEAMRSLALALLGGGMGYAFDPFKGRFLSAALGSLAGYGADRALASYEQEKSSGGASPNTPGQTPEKDQDQVPPAADNRREGSPGASVPERDPGVSRHPSALPVGTMLGNAVWFKSAVPKAVVPGAGAAAAAGSAGTWLPHALLATQAEQAVEGALDPDGTMRDLYGTRNPLEFWRWGSARNIGAALRMATQTLNQRRASRRTDRETMRQAVQRSARRGNLSPNLSMYL